MLGTDPGGGQLGAVTANADGSFSGQAGVSVSSPAGDLEVSVFCDPASDVVVQGTLTITDGSGQTPTGGVDTGFGGASGAGGPTGAAARGRLAGVRPGRLPSSVSTSPRRNLSRRPQPPRGLPPPCRPRRRTHRSATGRGRTGGHRRSRRLLPGSGRLLEAPRARARRRDRRPCRGRVHDPVRGRSAGPLAEGGLPDRGGLRAGDRRRAPADHLPRGLRRGGAQLSRQHRRVRQRGPLKHSWCRLSRFSSDLHDRGARCSSSPTRGARG